VLLLTVLRTTIWRRFSSILRFCEPNNLTDTRKNIKQPSGLCTGFQVVSKTNSMSKEGMPRRLMLVRLVRETSREPIGETTAQFGRATNHAAMHIARLSSADQTKSPILQFFFDSELCGGVRNNNGTLCVMNHDRLIT
jgi:hypothetical protein